MSDQTKQQGQNAEDRFVKVSKQNGLYTEKSSKSADMFAHYDYFLLPNSSTPLFLGIKVEVKSAKRMKRSDNNVNYDILYVEFRNVNGELGWLYGEADYVAFEQSNGFLMIKRKNLVDIAENRVKMTFTNRPTLYKSYKRFDRPNEHVGLISVSDVFGLECNVFLSEGIPSHSKIKGELV